MNLCCGGNCIVSLRDCLIQIGLKHYNYFEPFTKYGISYYLNVQLKNYIKQGRVSGYKIKTKRLGKWHYVIEVDLDLTLSQFVLIMKNVSIRLQGLGRG
jgi:hypothetical protein